MGRRELTLAVQGRPVRLSHPDRVMFARQGWTKLDLATHYVVCSGGALRAVYGRPTVLKRWPDGTAGEPFFQKRAPKPGPADGWQREYATVRFPSGRSADLFVPRHPADLVWMTQLHCLDFNPWPVRAEDVDHPDELRVDLDPSPDADYAAVRQVALVCREVLQDHGLTGWAKTSGSRGIHIYARIAPEWSFSQVRRAALALAREVERRCPHQATSAWWKEERHGVFVDYNQNARDRTMASAYSVRPTGLVSAPLTWDEVPEAELEDFPMDTFAARYARVGDLMAGMDDTPGRLDALLELSQAQAGAGQGEAPYPPHFPKGPGEPPRVQPSRRRRA
ncbi:MAG: ATP-dependent DNA ligase [Thermoleophilia bacterium]|nr:ATP-dependent DNA ligase [Thermoleophilia bacterium]